MTLNIIARGGILARGMAALFLALSITAVANSTVAAVSEKPVIRVLKKSQLFEDNNTKVAIREHNYAPGWTAPTHYHSSDLFIYVVSGAFEVTMEATGKVVYGAGEALKMEPETIMDARNASDTEPLKLAVFQVGNLDAPFVEPVE